MSEGKYEGTPNQKIDIQVLVYGEFSKYTQDYDLVDSVDNKGKQSKAKRYKGTYSKVAETSTRWDWVPLDKIQQIYVDYDQNTTCTVNLNVLLTAQLFCPQNCTSAFSAVALIQICCTTITIM